MSRSSEASRALSAMAAFLTFTSRACKRMFTDLPPQALWASRSAMHSHLLQAAQGKAGRALHAAPHLAGFQQLLVQSINGMRKGGNGASPGVRVCARPGKALQGPVRGQHRVHMHRLRRAVQPHPQALGVVCPCAQAPHPPAQGRAPHLANASVTKVSKGGMQASRCHPAAPPGTHTDDSAKYLEGCKGRPRSASCAACVHFC